MPFANFERQGPFEQMLAKPPMPEPPRLRGNHHPPARPPCTPREHASRQYLVRPQHKCETWSYADSQSPHNIQSTKLVNEKHRFKRTTIQLLALKKPPRSLAGAGAGFSPSTKDRSSCGKVSNVGPHFLNPWGSDQH